MIYGTGVTAGGMRALLIRRMGLERRAQTAGIQSVEAGKANEQLRPFLAPPLNKIN